MKLLHDARYAVAAKRVSEGHLATSRAEVAALLELCRELAADAERYRWLVNSGKYAPAMHGGGWGLRIGAGSKSTKVELDEAIDAAMQGANT